VTATPKPLALPGHVGVLVVGAGFAGLAVTERVLRDDPAADSWS
jgi:cation diffusion facilitator CzcD-associated flavoprotein CzcO